MTQSTIFVTEQILYGKAFTLYAILVMNGMYL